jgi:hypothetical protein
MVCAIYMRRSFFGTTKRAREIKPHEIQVHHYGEIGPFAYCSHVLKTRMFFFSPWWFCCDTSHVIWQVANFFLGPHKHKFHPYTWPLQIYKPSYTPTLGICKSHSTRNIHQCPRTWRPCANQTSRLCPRTDNAPVSKN